MIGTLILITLLKNISLPAHSMFSTAVFSSSCFNTVEQLKCKANFHVFLKEGIYQVNKKIRMRRRPFLEAEDDHSKNRSGAAKRLCLVVKEEKNYFI